MNIADTLLGDGLLTPAQLDQAMALHRTQGVRLDRALVQLGFISENRLLEVAGKVLDIPLANLTDLSIDSETLRSLPSKFVFRKRLVPVSKQNGTLSVATSDAFDMNVFDDIRLLSGLNVQPLLAPAEEIEKIIKSHYGVGGDTIDEMVGTGEMEVVRESAESSEDLLELAQEASVIKLVNEIIVEAVHERASDIHIEPYEHELSIRYRIDGVLQPASVPPQIHQFQAAIISRIKILASLNIAEKRLPQDGRIKFQIGGRQIDVRVSVIPMLFGEGIVMRILDKASVLFSLTDLGMDTDTFNAFKSLIERPHGIILVTGPTGSGKTTTLYAALNAIIGPELKVLTVEDPVEYHLQGVNQIPVDQRVGMTFERGLRAILRHDPDVVMIGEIRDLETARAAIQASLTGHLVLSTLHTNDAASAPTRLIDMGIEPYLVSSTLIGAMAQRLVRKICPHCKTAGPPNASCPADFAAVSGEMVHHGTGCAACRQTGYRGRTGLYELMIVNEAISDKVMQRSTVSELIRVARANGLRLLREDGWLKVRRGITTPEEVVTCTAV
ncbi:MAG: type II secretion system ATPase GspE [Verrucomicrobia bacterium]|nr:type II secretion system ATPase GspE [Verrucomicrobiota bacterium]